MKRAFSFIRFYGVIIVTVFVGELCTGSLAATVAHADVYDLTTALGTSAVITDRAGHPIMLNGTDNAGGAVRIQGGARQFQVGGRIGSAGFVVVPPTSQAELVRIKYSFTPEKDGFYYFRAPSGLAKFDTVSKGSVDLRVYLDSSQPGAPVDALGRLYLRGVRLSDTGVAPVSVPLGRVEAGHTLGLTLEVQLSPGQSTNAYTVLLLDTPTVESKITRLLGTVAGPGSVAITPRGLGEAVSTIAWPQFISGERPGAKGLLLDGSRTRGTDAQFVVNLDALDRNFQYALITTIQLLRPDLCNDIPLLTFTGTGDPYNRQESPEIFITNIEPESFERRAVNKPLGLTVQRRNAKLLIDIQHPNPWCRALVFGNPVVEADSRAATVGIAFARLELRAADWREYLVSRLDALMAAGVPFTRLYVASAGLSSHEGDLDVSDRAAEALVLAKQRGIEPLLSFGLTKYDMPPSYTSPPAECGSIGYKLSEADPALVLGRIAKTLDALKARSFELKYFEVGNEMNIDCSNGDIPLRWRPNKSNPADDALVTRIVHTYGELGSKVAELVRSRFPHAIVLGTGAASLASPVRGGILADYFYDRLRNINGKDYFTSTYDAAAIHVYPSLQFVSVKQGRKKVIVPDPSVGFAEATAAVDALAAAVGSKIPIWITEAGYNRALFNKAPALRYPITMRLINRLTSSPFSTVSNVMLESVDGPTDLKQGATHGWYNWGYLNVVEKKVRRGKTSVLVPIVKGIYPEAKLPGDYSGR